MSKRPVCPTCKRELVLAAIYLDDTAFNGYLCDCLPQPPNVAVDIIRARDWDDQSLLYEYASGDDDCDDGCDLEGEER